MQRAGAMDNSLKYWLPPGAAVVWYHTVHTFRKAWGLTRMAAIGGRGLLKFNENLGQD